VPAVPASFIEPLGGPVRRADLAADGYITKAPGGGELAGRSPVDRGKRGMKRSTLVDAVGVPLAGC
jgi:hypothetical protein